MDQGFLPDLLRGASEVLVTRSELHRVYSKEKREKSTILSYMSMVLLRQIPKTLYVSEAKVV